MGQSCSAVNYKPRTNTWVLRNCTLPPPQPIWKIKGWEGYFITSGIKWSGPSALIFSDSQCSVLGTFGVSLKYCKMKCEDMENCNALNYRGGMQGCVLRKCPYPIPQPNWDLGGEGRSGEKKWESFHIESGVPKEAVGITRFQLYRKESINSTITLFFKDQMIERPLAKWGHRNICSDPKETELNIFVKKEKEVEGISQHKIKEMENKIETLQLEKRKDKNKIIKMAKIIELKKDLIKSLRIKVKKQNCVSTDTSDTTSSILQSPEDEQDVSK